MQEQSERTKTSKTEVVPEEDTRTAHGHSVHPHANTEVSVKFAKDASGNNKLLGKGGYGSALLPAAHFHCNLDVIVNVLLGQCMKLLTMEGYCPPCSV